MAENTHSITPVNTMASIAQDTTIASPDLTKFTLFPKLPIEIRLKIFRYALPVGPKGVRMLRVAGEEFVTQSTTKVPIAKKPCVYTVGRPVDVLVDSWLTFRLLEHEHNSDVKDISLLGVCTESRGAYLKHFNGSLKAVEGGLIQFSEEDIVYITNLEDIFQTDEFARILFRGDGCQIVKCHNLALPIGAFWTIWINTHRPHLNCWGKFMAFLSFCKNSARVGPVWNDLAAFTGGEHDDDEAVGNDLLDAVQYFIGEVRSLWEESKKSGMNTEKMRELCIWGMDGERVEPMKTPGETLNTS